MDWSNGIITLFSAISAFAVTASAIIARKTMKSSDETSKHSLEIAKSSQETSKQHMRFVVFTECIRRFHEIKLHLREETSQEGKDYYRRLYIDLCSEEFFLNSKGYLYEDVWKIWSIGMKLNVKDNPDYIEVWETDKIYYDEKFRKFFDSFFENENK